MNQETLKNYYIFQRFWSQLMRDLAVLQLEKSKNKTMKSIPFHAEKVMYDYNNRYNYIGNENKWNKIKKLYNTIYYKYVKNMDPQPFNRKDFIDALISKISEHRDDFKKLILSKKIEECLQPSIDSGYSMFMETLLGDLDKVKESMEFHPKDFKHLMENVQYTSINPEKIRRVKKLYEKMYDIYLKKMNSPYEMKTEKMQYVNGWIKEIKKNESKFRKLWELS